MATKISFGNLQEMYHGRREYPVTERGMLQLMEGCEREMSTLIDDRKEVNASLKVLRGSIKKILDRLDKFRNGEMLDFRDQDEEVEPEDVQLSISDWRQTLDMSMGKEKGEKFSPDDDPEEEETEEADA